MIDRSSATLCRSLSTRSSVSLLATFGSQSALKRSEEKFVVDAVDSPLDRLIALFGFDGDRCRVLCLAGTQAWRNRRRGAGDNIVVVDYYKCSSFPHYQRIPTKEKLPHSSYHSITATVSMFPSSVKTTPCRTHLLLKTTLLVTVTYSWSRDVKKVLRCNRTYL